MSALESRLLQFVILAPPAVFLGWWAWQCVQVWVQRARAMRAHELAPPRPLPIREGWAAHSARLAEELDACRGRCHVCGIRVYVGETAHDAEPADDGAERFTCTEHCEVCR